MDNERQTIWDVGNIRNVSLAFRVRTSSQLKYDCQSHQVQSHEQ